MEQVRIAMVLRREGRYAAANPRDHRCHRVAATAQSRDIAFAADPSRLGSLWFAPMFVTASITADALSNKSSFQRGEAIWTCTGPRLP